jgi:hypothetical protein
VKHALYRRINKSCSKLFIYASYVKVVLCFIIDSYVINDAILYLIILLKTIK